MAEFIPELQPGIGFHLKTDGQWGQEKIPAEVLRDNKFSGYLTIHGYKCSIFETPDGDQWGEKSIPMPVPKVSPLATKVASMWLRAKNDLTNQVSDTIEDEREDSDYDKSIAEYCDEAISTIEKLREDCRTMSENFIAEAHKLAEAKDAKVQKVLADKVRDSVVSAALEIKMVGSKTLSKLVSELAAHKVDAGFEDP